MIIIIVFIEIYIHYLFRDWVGAGNTAKVKSRAHIINLPHLVQKLTMLSKISAAFNDVAFFTVSPN